jgi:hypothetical protein
VAITLVPKYVRAVAEQLNAYYRVLKGTDPDSIDLRLNGGGRFAVHHSGTNAVVFQVTDAGSSGFGQGTVTSYHIADGTIMDADIGAGAAINGGKIALGTISGGASGQIAPSTIASSNILDGTIVDADISPAAAINGGKIALGTISGGASGQIAPSTIASSNILDGTIVNADIAAAGTANIAITKLADIGTNNVLRSSGAGNVGGKVVTGDIAANTILNGNIDPLAGIAITKLADVGANNVLRSNGAGNVAGKIVTNDMAANSINGDRLTDGTVPGGKITGGAPPPNGTGAPDAWKAYATDAAGTTVALRQIVTEMLAGHAVTNVFYASPAAVASLGTTGAWFSTGQSLALTGLTVGSLVVFLFAATANHTLVNKAMQYGVSVDSPTTPGFFTYVTSPLAGAYVTWVLAGRFTTTATSHTLYEFFQTDAATLARAGFPCLMAVELKR